MAPQSPDVAPGPSSASFDLHSSGSSRHDDLHDDKFASPRGGLDKGEHVPVEIRHVSPPSSPSHQDRLREELEGVHTRFHIKEVNDFCLARGRAPPDLSQDDLEILQSKYAQLSLALEESLYASSSHRRGPSPAFASHRVVSPSDAHPLRPDSSSLHGPRLSSRPRSPSQDRSRSRDDYSGHLRHSRRSQERYLERFVPSDMPSHSRRPCSRGSPSPKQLEFSQESLSQHQMRFASRRSPSQHQMRFASRGSPSPGEWDSHQGGHPLQSEWDSHQEGHLLQSEWDSLLPPLHSEWDSLQGSPLLNSAWNSHQEGHPLQSEWDSHQEGHPLQSEWDSHQEGHPLQSEWDSLLAPGLVAARDPFQGILLQGHATQGIPFLQRASPLCLSEWDSLQEILLLPNDNVLSRGTQILLDDGIHSELRLVRLQLRDPSRGLLPPILIHLYDKIRKLKTPLCQLQLRP